jgi:hypothetical protein
LPTIFDPFATVPELFARRSINLLIGTPKSGRTRLALTHLNEYLSAGKFFDYSLKEGQKPEQVGAITCARTFDDMFYKMSSMGLGALQAAHSFPIEKWDPKACFDDSYTVLDSAYQRLCQHTLTPVKFLFIDGFQLLQSSGKVNDQHAVGEHYRELQQFCENRDCTILGTVGTAKMKSGESYPLLSHRVMGSAQWTESANTLIGLAVLDTNLPAVRRSAWRELTIQASGSRDRTLYMDFDTDGRLWPKIRQQEAAESTMDAELDRVLELMKPGEQFGRRVVMDWAERLKISPRKADEWIASRLELGFLEKKGNTTSTVYWRPLTN